MKHANISGIATCLLSHVEQQEWVVDSGVTHHIVSNNNMFFIRSKLARVGEDKVNMPNGAKVDISHSGEALVLQNKTVKYVLFVPDFKPNLLSVSKVTRQLSCFVSFYLDFCIFQDPYSGMAE